MPNLEGRRVGRTENALAFSATDGRAQVYSQRASVERLDQYCASPLRLAVRKVQTTASIAVP